MMTLHVLGVLSTIGLTKYIFIFLPMWIKTGHASFRKFLEDFPKEIIISPLSGLLYIACLITRIFRKNNFIAAIHETRQVALLPKRRLGYATKEEIEEHHLKVAAFKALRLSLFLPKDSFGRFD
jgi:hypothetical protein